MVAACVKRCRRGIRREPIDARAERGGRPADRRDREPGHPQPRDHPLLLAARRGLRGTERRGRELVHVRDVGLATGGADDPRRGSARAARAQARRSAAGCCIRSRRSGAGCCAAASSSRETRIGRLTAELHTPFDAFERASDAVARGNLKVFEEIGLEFARYLHECPPDAPGRVAAVPAVPRRDCGPATRPRAALPAPGVRALRAPAARARPEGARGARCPREPRDRPPRADAPAAGDSRGARRRVRDPGGPGAARARGAVPVGGALVAGRPASGRRRRRRRRGRCAASRRAGSRAR